MSISDDHVIHWNATVTVAVETAIASTAPTTQHSCRGHRPNYGPLVGRAPVLQTNEYVTSPQVNREFIDALEDATTAEQEDEEICHQKHWTVHEFEIDKLIMYEDFKHHGIESARPMIDEHKRLFLSP